MKKITIKDIKCLFEMLFLHLESLKIEEVYLDDKWYWKVNDIDKYVFEQVPSELIVGNFLDDIDRIEKLLDDKNISLMDLSTLSNLLICIENNLCND